MEHRGAFSCTFALRMELRVKLLIGIAPSFDAISQTRHSQPLDTNHFALVRDCPRRRRSTAFAAVINWMHRRRTTFPNSRSAPSAVAASLQSRPMSPGRRAPDFAGQISARSCALQSMRSAFLVLSVGGRHASACLPRVQCFAFSPLHSGVSSALFR